MTPSLPRTREEIQAFLQDSLANLEERQRNLTRMTNELAGQRVTKTSEQGSVRVTVDGNGKLIDIAVSTNALRRGNVAGLGEQIKQAVVDARAEAGAKSRKKLSVLVGSSGPTKEVSSIKISQGMIGQ